MRTEITFKCTDYSDERGFVSRLLHEHSGFSYFAAIIIYDHLKHDFDLLREDLAIDGSDPDDAEYTSETFIECGKHNFDHIKLVYHLPNGNCLFYGDDVVHSLRLPEVK